MNLENTIKQRVRYVDYNNKSALVLNRKGKAYPVQLSDKVIANGIQEKDLAFIRIINRVWIIVDFESKNLDLACNKYEEVMEEY